MDTIGTQLAVLYTVEPLYCGHHWDQLAVLYTVEPFYCGHHWDAAGCPVYSGTSLLWTPLGRSWLSCIQWNLSIVDTIGTQLAVLSTVEPFYSGHHWDPAGCPVYGGTSLLWTPLGRSWLSCIQWNLSIVDTIGTQLAVLSTVEPFYSGHHWDPAGCPVYSGTSLLWTPLGRSWLSCLQWNLSIVDTIGTQLAALYREVFLIQR